MICARSCNNRIGASRKLAAFQSLAYSRSCFVSSDSLASYISQDENSKVMKRYNSIVPRTKFKTTGILSGISTSTIFDPFIMNKRTFSSNTTTSCEANNTLASPEAAMQKFEEAANAAENPSKTPSIEDISSIDPNVWTPSWWPSDQMVQLIYNVQEATGWNYAITIGAVTLAFRTAMVPMFVKAQQNSSRMAHVKPEMDVLKAKIDRVDPKDLEMQQKYAKEMQNLFRKYDVNPLRSIAIPLLQFPVFMSMFFGLKNMPEIYFNELSTGGMLWFPDLTAPDPYYIMPVASALSFLLMMELGKEQMMASAPEQGRVMLNFFRGMAVLMVPITYSFPTAVFCYWSVNNTFSLVQSAVFHNKAMRKSLGIWDPPKPIPGAPPAKGMIEMIQDSVKNSRKDSKVNSTREKIKMHNASIDKRNADRMSSNDDRSVAGRRRRSRPPGAK
jgi:YidC/Oxa1 family membrane protein insertase